MKNTTKSLLAFGAAFAMGSAMADTSCGDVTGVLEITYGTCSTPSGTGASKRTDNNVYVGLVWSFGQTLNKTPDVLLGFRSTQVNSANKVSGGDLNFRFQTAKNFALESVRLAYVGGNRDALANVGAGYSFTSASALFTGAVQTAHVRAGTDYLLADKKFVPYFEVNTLQRIKPTGSDLSCASGSLRTVNQNIGPNDYLNLETIQNGLITPNAELSAMDSSLGQFLPAGTKTCYTAEAG